MGGLWWKAGMAFLSHGTHRALIAASAWLTLLPGSAAGDDARMQTKLDVRYTISAARVTIGHATWAVEIGGTEYSATTIGQAGGALRVLTTTRGSAAARGQVKDGRLVPVSFASNSVSDDDAAEVNMTLASSNVSQLTVTPPDPPEDRVQIVDAHRRGIVDPLSAVLVTIGGTGELLSAESCTRTLSIFDGRRRYDLALSFRRLDQVKADKGYRGKAVVCAARFQAIAGHRQNSKLVDFLSNGRDIELWFVPVGETRVLAPFRLQITSMLGNVVVHAERFEAATIPAASAPAAAPPVTNVKTP
jgi:hypothetical protein